MFVIVQFVHDLWICFGCGKGRLVSVFRIYEGHWEAFFAEDSGDFVFYSILNEWDFEV